MSQFRPYDRLPPDEDYDEEELEPRGRRCLPVVIIVVMVLFAGGFWYVYSAGKRGQAGDVPLIHAEDGATKMRPAEPGGMSIPDQDKLVYGQGKPAPEKLLPAPEAPMPRPAQSEAPPGPDSSSEAPAATTPTAIDQVPPSTIQAPPGVPAGRPGPPPVPVTAPPANPNGAVSAAAPSANSPPVKSEAAHQAIPAAQSPSAPASAGWRLQLGALRTADSARSEWEKLKRSQKDLLGNLAAAWPRADLGDRGIFYRIQAGPITEQASAERICNELKNRHVGCILVRP